jgi:propionyl-CoA synthetase
MIRPEDSMPKGTLQTAFDYSLRDPTGFRAEAAEAVYWYKKWVTVLDDSHQPFYRWFIGG